MADDAQTLPPPGGDELDPLLGRVIADKFLIEERLGRGGMGAVYRARQLALDKPVAIKVLRRELAGDPLFVRRFHREAQAASRLEHPSSVRVIDFGSEPDGLLYIVMELLRGRHLGAVLEADFPLDQRRIATLLAQVLAALAVAHELGIVHRDLKPENIMILDGRDDDGRPVDVVKVCDFGIATLANVSSSITTDGLILGTPDYMSPEQARGEVLDARSDLYSVGVILYQLITGELPFSAETPLGVALRHVNDPVRPPSELMGSIAPELERICMRALEKPRDRRWASAQEMRAELRAFVEATPHPAPLLPGRAHVPLGDRDTETLTDLGSVGSPPVPSASRSATRTALLIALVVSVVGLVALSVSRESRVEALAPSTSATPAVTTPTLASTQTSATVAMTASAPPTGIEPAAETGPQIATTLPPPAAAPANGKAVLPKSTPTSTATAVAKEEDPVPAPAPTPVAPPPPPSPPPPTKPQPNPSAAAAAPAAVAPSPVDAAHATVTVGAVSATNGLPASSVRTALSHAPFTRCYRDALVGRTSPAKGSAVLRLTIDDTGHVVLATLGGATFLPAVRGCIESAARAVTVKNVDTGDATASVTLSFEHP